MYKIKSLTEKENNRFEYWNNKIGWTKKKYADKFTEEETKKLNLPTWSKWEKIK